MFIFCLVVSRGEPKDYAKPAALSTPISVSSLCDTCVKLYRISGWIDKLIPGNHQVVISRGSRKSRRYLSAVSAIVVYRLALAASVNGWNSNKICGNRIILLIHNSALSMKQY